MRNEVHPISYAAAEFLSVDAVREVGDLADIRIGITLVDPDGDTVNICLSMDDAEMMTDQLVKLIRMIDAIRGGMP